MYSRWEVPHATTKRNGIYADAAAHRLISDLSVFIAKEKGHRVIAAGDLNILYGYGEHGSRYWKDRYQTMFDRFSALAMRDSWTCGALAAHFPIPGSSGKGTTSVIHFSRQGIDGMRA
jgi:hypothetical protein